MWHKAISWLDRKKYLQLSGFAKKPNYLQEVVQAEGYYSQCGQDKWIVETLLPGVTSGVFVDIGAHDGVSFSNTLYLEQRLGWVGVAVEPIPEVFDKLKANRQCITVNGCVGSRSGKARFLVIHGYSEMLSGLVDQYDVRHLNRIKHEINIHGGERREIEVDCYTLNELFEAHKLDHVDYLNIDVEGAEYSMLSAFNFDRYNISIIGVENNYCDYRIPRLLIDNGFEFHSIVGDEFYVRFTSNRDV